MAKKRAKSAPAHRAALGRHLHLRISDELYEEIERGRLRFEKALGAPVSTTTAVARALNLGLPRICDAFNGKHGAGGEGVVHLRQPTDDERALLKAHAAAAADPSR